MIEQISDYTFPQKPKLYNSERRETIGCISWRDNDSQYYHNISWGEDNNCQEFHLNVENTSQASPGGPITLYTYANNVKVKAYYYLSSSSETDISVALTYQYYDKDNHVISSLGSSSVTLNSTTRYGATLTNVPFWYSPCGVDYADVEESWEGSRYMDGIFYYQRNSGSPYDPIDINGAYSTTERFNYYGRTESQVSPDDWDDFWDAIENGGDGTPISPIMPSDDTSEPGGGDAAEPDYNPFSDPIDFPGLPTGGDSISTGFIRVYTPSTSQLQDLAGVLWSDAFVETIKKIQNDPMEAIISLHSIPISISGTTVTCRVGNFNTGVGMPAVSTQFHTINLGSIRIPEHWASALDYSPYVTVDMFVPFCGVVQLQVDDIVGRTVSVQMNLDIISGAALISVKCDNSVLYTYNTNIIFRHTISQSSFGPFYQSVLGMLGSTASGLASGGVGGALGGAIGGAVNVALSKQHAVSRGGSIGGATGVLGNFTPYLIIHRPIQSLASGFAHFKGYPSNITTTLNSVSGYTEVESVHLSGITCTDSEKAEIEALLYNGVIL